MHLSPPPSSTFAPGANKSPSTKMPRFAITHTSNLGALLWYEVAGRQTLTGTLDNNRALLWPPFMVGQFFICVMHNLLLVRGCGSSQQEKRERACVITHCPRSKSMRACERERERTNECHPSWVINFSRLIQLRFTRGRCTIPWIYGPR